MRGRERVVVSVVVSVVVRVVVRVRAVRSLRIRVRIKHNDEVCSAVVRGMNIGWASGVNGGACDGGGDRFAVIFRRRSLPWSGAGLRRESDRAQSTCSNGGEFNVCAGCHDMHRSFNPRTCSSNPAR